jgi:hypothetical protein
MDWEKALSVACVMGGFWVYGSTGSGGSGGGGGGGGSAAAAAAKQ